MYNRVLRLDISSVTLQCHFDQSTELFLSGNLLIFYVRVWLLFRGHIPVDGSSILDMYFS